ncbi:MAG: glycosyltransferase [bacterium]|nr:glycosyltransferase [bacterium]
MKIYIFTEGGASIGFGHITRCISLYQAFLSKGYSPIFLVNADHTANKILKEVNHKIINWTKQNELFNTLKLGNQDIAIIDSYLAYESVYTKIAELVKLTICFDDYNRINYPKGIIINAAINSKKTDYAKKELTCLLGNSYIALRKNFWDVPKKRIKQNIKTVLITFGGRDDNGLTPRVLKFLVKNYPFIKKIVIVGAAFTNKKRVQSPKDKTIITLKSPSVEKIHDAMCRADVAISAGGQTINELARNGVPTIAFISNPSERSNILGWQQSGFAICGGLSANFVPKKLEKFIKVLAKEDERRQRSVIGQKMCDGKGALRIISRIFNNY